MGKQKGAFQITFERSFCTENLMKNGEKVSANGKELKDSYTDKIVTKPMLVYKIRYLLVAHDLPATGNRTELLA